MPELFYAFGWAQMANHGDLLLELYGQARGRAAEYWGRRYIQGDQYVRIMGVPQRARTWYQAQSPQMRTYLNAFVAGINAYAQTHPDQLNPERQLALPVVPEDPLAHLQRVIHLSFVAPNQAREAQNWQRAGSNAWAVAPSRSASGHAMLLANPHLPWGGMTTWFEVQLRGPGLDAYGATLVGFPLLGIAFNNHLGWTHTNNPMDGADLYELELMEGGYRWNGRVQAFAQSVDTLRVRQEDGTLRAEPLLILRSVHGPVLARKQDKAVALRLAGLDQPHLMEQYWDMIRATSLAQFEAALQRLQMPFFNVVYADRDGHILYLFGGHTPRRSRGDWGDWQGVVPGKYGGDPVDGNARVRGFATPARPARRLGAKHQRFALDGDHAPAAGPGRFSALYGTGPALGLSATALRAHVERGCVDLLWGIDRVQTLDPPGNGRPRAR